ncbi:hypothetical protein RhiirC2_782424 [Rhizophagus irregularis]|uniref:Uncharacterized protein n=1 Tax=Rhizophagus irregularis TaxID=588596 RepID=A0A2N1N353_9GLOM|nr:hypothetical protein RhiirC2_782424 [Rhizophagus irregularis]
MSDNEILQPIQQKLSIQIVDDKVTKYWNTNDADEYIKPLEWWKTHSTEYPEPPMYSGQFSPM